MKRGGRVRHGRQGDRWVDEMMAETMLTVVGAMQDLNIGCLQCSKVTLPHRPPAGWSMEFDAEKRQARIGYFCSLECEKACRSEHGTPV